MRLLTRSWPKGLRSQNIQCGVHLLFAKSNLVLLFFLVILGSGLGVKSSKKLQTNLVEIKKRTQTVVNNLSFQ